MSWLDEAKSKKQQDDSLKAQEWEHKKHYRNSICDPLSPIVRRLLLDLGNAYWGEGQFEIHQMAYLFDTDPLCVWTATKEVANGGSWFFLVELIDRNDWRKSQYLEVFGHYPTEHYFKIAGGEFLLTVVSHNYCENLSPMFC